ncbi:hypothetical protein HPP92_017300 [Vanilla planifolia]|uniref:Germin-like protein n=1 Tax=Vanilla planifolia TaxID=51239 RepID=A0A835QCH9_VANPL|nr:hypothetical protein HPP92_017300 [Vanilla planifolia]
MKTRSFKEEYSFEERFGESRDIVAKYPDRVPVIAERFSRCDLPEMEKKKYLVPRDMSVGQFIHILSGRLHLAPGKALFVFVKNTLPRTCDPDILDDFIVPPGTNLDGNFFTFTGLRQSLLGGLKDVSFKATKASQVEFPALHGQSVSYAVLQYGPNGINPPHTHPRSTELLLVVQGQLSVGFVTADNKLFTQMLNQGDVFAFPKGLVHFQKNQSPKIHAVAISAFGSANPGTVSLPKTIFGSGIDNWVLAQSFKTDTNTIEKLVSANSA